jgi:hypothetical protein
MGRAGSGVWRGIGGHVVRSLEFEASGKQQAGSRQAVCIPFSSVPFFVIYLFIIHLLPIIHQSIITL